MGFDLKYPISQGTWRFTTSGCAVLVLRGYYADADQRKVIWICEEAATGEEVHVPESEFIAERPNAMEVLAWASI